MGERKYGAGFEEWCGNGGAVRNERAEQGQKSGAGNRVSVVGNGRAV